MSFRKQQRKVLVVATIQEGKPISHNRNRKSYSSFIKSEHSKSKNIILNELSTDIGYPQQVLVPNKVKIREKKEQKDYLRLNIKKMRNPVAGPISASKLIASKRTRAFDPSKILIFKKYESNMKNETKITLNKEITIPYSTRSAMRLNRMEQVLQFNDPVNEMRQTFSSMTPNRETRERSNSSVRRLTQSSLQKRCMTAKKRAYVEVFGDEVSFTQGCEQAQKQPESTITHKRLSGKEVRAAQRAKIANDSVRFQKIIGKLESLKQVFSGDIDQKDLDKQIDQKVNQQQKMSQNQRNQQQKMVNDVRNFAKRDRQRKYNKGYSKIDNLTDLQIIDPIFCRQLRQHKEKKVGKMRLDLEIDVLRTTKTQIQIQSTSSIKGLVQTPFDISFEQEIVEIIDTPPLKKQQTLRPFRYLTQYQKTQNFLRNFFRVKQQGDKFGIPIEHMYYGLFTKPSVYELEGSYLFFRAIEQGNISTIKSMIKIQATMVFQIDDQGRTPLIYATQINSIKVVRELLKVGVNQDALSFRDVNALFYAIRHKNIQMIYELLYAGCSPWSPPGSDFNHLLRDPKDSKIRMILQLARRISIILKFVKYSARLEVWKNQRKLIQKLYNQIR